MDASFLAHEGLLNHFEFVNSVLAVVNLPDPAAALGFLRLVLSGYMLATRYKTRYRWLHGGYMRNLRQKLKSPTLSIK